MWHWAEAYPTETRPHSPLSEQHLVGHAIPDCESWISSNYVAAGLGSLFDSVLVSVFFSDADSLFDSFFESFFDSLLVSDLSSELDVDGDLPFLA